MKETLRVLERILSEQNRVDKFGNRLNNIEILLFTRGAEFGVAVYDNEETNSEHLDELECEYANSLEQAIDKAIKRWS